MQDNQVTKAIKKRRSVRSYLDIQIPDNDLSSILDAGLYAPSGKNRQPWRFLIVKDADIIKTIAKSTVYSRFIRNAPIMILMFAKQDTLYPLEKDMIGIGACLQNILLAATEKQYGSCIIGELYGRQNELSEHIKLECKDYLLVCGIALGKIKLVSKDIREKKLSDFVLDTIQ